MSDTNEVLALLGWAVRHSWDDHHNEDGDGIRALVQRARNQHDAERATIAAHDAGTPAGGVWLTAEEVANLAAARDAVEDVRIKTHDRKVIDASFHAREFIDRVLRKARGGGT